MRSKWFNKSWLNTLSHRYYSCRIVPDHETWRWGARYLQGCSVLFWLPSQEGDIIVFQGLSVDQLQYFPLGLCLVIFVLLMCLLHLSSPDAGCMIATTTIMDWPAWMRSQLPPCSSATAVLSVRNPLLACINNFRHDVRYLKWQFLCKPLTPKGWKKIFRLRRIIFYCFLPDLKGKCLSM